MDNSNQPFKSHSLELGSEKKVLFMENELRYVGKAEIVKVLICVHEKYLFYITVYSCSISDLQFETSHRISLSGLHWKSIGFRKFLDK